jgi:hypothetical protein
MNWERTPTTTRIPLSAILLIIVCIGLSKLEYFETDSLKCFS